MRGDLGDESANQLQAVCRLLVNYLRAGELIDANLVEELRTALFSCGWLGDDNGRPPANRHTQQDASELYLFLMEKLQMPYLPLEVRMVHGADYDESDSRMVTQRVLEISLLDDADDGGGAGGRPLKLQELLENYFFDNRVEQLERNLKVKDSDDKPKGPAKVRTNAWLILSMYPFYTPQSELGDNTAAYPADAPLVIPLLIKRYRVDSHGAVHRIRRSVMVPLTMDITSIVSQDSSRDNKDSTLSAYRPRSRVLPMSSGLSPPPYSSSEQYQLVLRSAICHKGLDTSSGHYVSLCMRLRAMRTDELWRSNVTQSTGSAAAPAARGVAKTLTMPASANSGAMATEMRVLQQLASHRSPGDSSQRRRSCPDLCSSFLSDTQTSRVVLDNVSNVDVSSIDASTALTSTSSIRHVIRAVGKQQELPPPYDAQASCDANKSDERLTESREFVRFDDMDIEHGRVQRFSTGEGRCQCLDEIERDGYLLFYVLQQVVGRSEGGKDGRTSRPKAI
ncbi:hypothetical protein GGF44_000538 [Coemansia sp. RSA 1694]|nr:hypothetical protein GGF44_000538 [Coemansia sp. RSA 1694]